MVTGGDVGGKFLLPQPLTPTQLTTGLLPGMGGMGGLETEPQSYRISPLSVQRRANNLNPELASRRGNSIALSRPHPALRRKQFSQINLSLDSGSAISGN